MPTTSPRALNSGPPELPGLMATSVCRKGTKESSGRVRPLALTTPAVTLLSKPKGEPMASTQSPTRRSAVFPSETVGRFFASMRSTATSVLGCPLALYQQLRDLPPPLENLHRAVPPP